MFGGLWLGGDLDLAGMNGTVTITGNKMFVVLKRRSRAVEAVVSAASDYLRGVAGLLRPGLRPGETTVMVTNCWRAARALLSSGLQPLDALLIELACRKMPRTSRARTMSSYRVFPKAQMQAQLQRESSRTYGVGPPT